MAHALGMHAAKMQWLQTVYNFLWLLTSPFLLCNPFPTPSVSASVLSISAHACPKRLDLTRWTLPNSHDSACFETCYEADPAIDPHFVFVTQLFSETR